MSTGIWYAHNLTDKQKNCLQPLLKKNIYNNPSINTKLYACSFVNYDKNYHHCYCPLHILTSPNTPSVSSPQSTSSPLINISSPQSTTSSHCEFQRSKRQRLT